MTNEQIVILIKAGRNTADNMKLLYEQTKAFIHTIAIKYQGQAELDDLEQEGYLALYPAIDGYDPAQGVKFLTYAAYHITQRIQRYIWQNGGNVRVPYHCQERIRKYRWFCNAFYLEYGREPSDSTAAVALGLSVEQVREIKQDEARRHAGSLERVLKEDDDLTLADTIASGEQLEEEAAERLDLEGLRSVLWPMVDALPNEQGKVLRMKYQKGMNAMTIAGTLCVDMAAVRQSERKAMQRLRSPASAKRLRPFLPELMEAQAYRGSGAERFRQTWTSSTERVALRI